MTRKLQIPLNRGLRTDDPIEDYDSSSFTSGNRYTSTGATASDASWSVQTNYTRVLPNTDYTYFGGIFQDRHIVFYDKNKNVIDTVVSSDGSVDIELDFTTPANCYYIRCTVETTKITTFKIQYAGSETIDIANALSDAARRAVYYEPGDVVEDYNGSSFTASTYYNVSGEATSEAGWSTQTNYTRVLPNTDYTYFGGIFQARAIIFYDQDFNVIGNALSFDGSVDIELDFTTPANCYYIRCTVETTKITTFKIQYKDTSGQLNIEQIADLKKLKKNLVRYTDDIIADSAVWVDGEYYNGVNGNSVSEAGWSRQDTFTEVTPLTIYKYTGGIQQSRGIIFLDLNKDFISGIGGTDSLQTTTTFTTPVACKYIQCTVKTSEKANFEIKYEGENQLVLSDTQIITLKSIMQSYAIVQELYDEEVYVSAPSKIYITEGNTLEIFKYGVINAIDPDKYWLRLNNLSGGKGNFYDRVLRYTAGIGDSNMSFNFQLRNDAKQTISEAQNTTVEVVEKKSSPAVARYGVIIGDSFIDSDTFPEELVRRLTGSDTVDGITGDNLSNINFVGTKDSALSSLKHEGYSSKTYSWFSGASSPFYNPISEEIDFDYYCSDVLTAPIAQLDFAYIVLGTNNDEESNAVISAFWQKLIDHNPDIRIIVSGRIPAARDGGAGADSLSSSNNTFWGLTGSRVFEYNRRVETLTDSYSDNVLFVDLSPVFDSQYNFPAVVEDANIRNSTDQVTRNNNAVHPSSVGYRQLADAWYHASHFFFDFMS